MTSGCRPTLKAVISTSDLCIRPSTLSLCMIARNESEHIGRCLQSAKDFVDEIIVVDTGSTDDTREIARSFGATVIEAEWQDDFSLARNLSLEQATGDWIHLPRLRRGTGPRKRPGVAGADPGPAVTKLTSPRCPT